MLLPNIELDPRFGSRPTLHTRDIAKKMMTSTSGKMIGPHNYETYSDNWNIATIIEYTEKIPNMKYVSNCCYYSLKLELFDYNRYFSDFSEAWNYQKNKKISDIQKNPNIQNFRNWFFQLSECGIFSFWLMTSISPYFSKNNNFRKYIIADIKNLQNWIIRLYEDGISSFWVLSSRSL